MKKKTSETRYSLHNLPTTLIKSGQTYQYRYDGSGKRIEKVQPNGTFEAYRRGANGELLAIYDNLGALKQFELEGIGEMRVEGGQWRVSVYDKDLFGNIRNTVAQNGTIERTYDADVWGYEYEAKQGIPSKTYDEKFLGNPRDRETGFDFMGARLYESRLGLFLGAEPLYDELQCVSPYSYGLNNPVKHKDKDGNFPIDVVLDVAFIVSDVIDIAQTMMKGEAVSGAQWGALAGDVVGAVVPGLTGVGKMVKAGDAAVDAAKGMEKATELSGQSSKYELSTHKSRGKESVPNRQTDVTKEEFEKNLEANGYEKTPTKDGKAHTFTKDGDKYTTRDESGKGSNKQKQPTADYRKAGSEKKIDHKIRLESK